MARLSSKKIRKFNLVTHRDVGFFFSGLILIYCVSGIALNHIDDWNPDFILNKTTILLKDIAFPKKINTSFLKELGTKVGEKDYKVYDFPTSDQVKIYYEDASLHVYLKDKKAIYEQVSKRAVFYQVNVLHRNSINGWKWFSDVFAFFLIVITLTGLFVIKGKNGIAGRGKWLILIGFIIPITAVVLHALS